MSRTTISEVLAGRRLASASFLAAFLEACGIADQAAQRPWLAARARLAQTRSAAEDRSLPEGESADGARPGPSDVSVTGGQLAAARCATPGETGRTGARERWRRYAATAAVVILVVAAVLLGVAYRRSRQQVRTTIDCRPAGCAITGGWVTVTGRLSGRISEDREAILLTQVDGTKRWSIGPPIVPTREGSWAHGIGIGNPVPQTHDRQFLICAYLLPGNALDQITRLMMARHGDGLTDTDLPTSRVRLACVSVVRLANT